MRPRRWIGAAAVIALALALISVRSLDAPLFLYPSSASLPAGLYMRASEPVRSGAIVVFPVPEIARRYHERDGAIVPSDYLFIKPVAAGPGDLVCNDRERGLEVNGVWLAPVATSDSRGRSLPVWRSCRLLRENEFFLFSNTVPNSFDSRYYGPVQDHQIRASYRRVSWSALPTQL